MDTYRHGNHAADVGLGFPTALTFLWEINGGGHMREPLVNAGQLRRLLEWDIEFEFHIGPAPSFYRDHI